MSGSAFGPGADTPPPSLTSEPTERLLQLIYVGEAEPIVDFLDEHHAPAPFTISFLGNMSAKVLGLVFGDEFDPAAGDILALEQLTPTAQATPALRYVIACAEPDHANARAHLDVLLSDDRLWQAAVPELVKHLHDFMHLLSSKEHPHLHPGLNPPAAS